MSNRNVEKLARELNALKNQIASYNTPQLAYSALEDGQINEYDRDGRLVSIIGSQPDGTHGVVVVAGPVPPAPAGLQAVGSAGMFKVIWNGQFVDNNVAPMDYARIEIHISTEQGFAIDPLPGSQTRVATIESAGGGEVAIIRVPADYYVKAITRSLSGQYSEPSNEMQVHVDSVVTDEELEAVLDELNAARADLEDLQITLENVQTDLEDAEAILGTIGEIDGRLDNLDLAVIGLDTDVANATSAANNATTKADAASSLAGAAQSAANAAATAASNAAAEAGAATQAAQAAEQQALNAANLVADKSTVYWGMPEPAGDTHGLWIVDGKPHVWDGNAWVENTNPDVVQAVQDAADAKAQADAANTKANEAAQRAADAEQAAQDAANSAGQALTAAETAQTAAASAQVSAESAADLSGDAAAASQAASAAAGAAQLVAEAAEQAAQEAQDVADAASTTAQDALSEAANAALAATTAIGTANAATQAANAAQDSADTANSEALAAAGLAGSKGEVIYQASAPTGARAVSQNLWIRTTDNKPHTYDGSKWVAVTDKTASDAAASAASANSAAQNAWNHANTANNTANTALSTANGKNKTTYSPNAPGSAANTAGDIWFRRSSTGTIIGQWEGLGGTAWAARTLDNQVIANLDAGKITTGFIDADRIQAGAITIGKLAEGSVATPSDLNTAMVTAAADAQSKANAAKTAAETAAKAYADGEIDAAALAVAQQAASDATSKANAAKQAAIDAAAADAKAKADAARDAAVSTADLAAQIKANAARDAAISTAASDATTKANNARTSAISTAAADATTKANNAKAAAETAAALTAQAKADQAKADALAGAATTAQQKADAAKAQAIADATAAAAVDAKNKADAAQAAAISAAALDATTKANNAKAGAEAAAKTYADGAIANTVNLVDNPARTMGLGRWNGATAVMRDFNGTGTTVLESSTTTNATVYSSNAQDMFKVDPSKAYQISVWLEDEKALAAPGAAGTAQVYLGIHVYQENGTTMSPVIPVNTAGVASAASTNFYFFNASASGAPIGGFRRYVAYLMPMGTDPANMKNLGINVNSNAILSADARRGRIRVLNYNNHNTPGGRKVWIAHPTVVEVDAVALENAAKAAATADEATGTITLWKHPGATLIDGGKIFTDSITANQIAAGAITADEIAANAVTAAKIKAGAITAGKIDANAVTAGTIAAGAITAGTIAANAVVAGTIAADAITARELKALSVQAGHIVAGAVVADKIAAGAILADKIAANAITAEKIAAGAITAGKIVALTITGDKIAANAISADKITANAITTDKLVANSVIADKIAANAITAEKIAARQILADHIKAGEINVGHLSAGTLSASNITAGIINASIGISTQGSLIAGDTTTAWSEMNSQAFAAYVVNTEAGVRTVNQIASIGQGQSFFSSTDADGNVRAAMTPAGDVGAQNLEVANIAQVGQHLVIGETDYNIATHGVGEFGPVINGQGLFDNQFLAHVENHPRLGVNNKWMLGLAYGNVARAARVIAIGQWTTNSSYKREILSFKAEIFPGRKYNISSDIGLITRAGGSRSDTNFGLTYVRWSSAGQPPPGINSGSTLSGTRSYFEGDGSSKTNSFGEFVGGSDIPAGMTTFTLVLEVFGGVVANHSGPTAWLSLDDMGRHATESWPIPTGFSHDSGGSGSTSPVPNPVREYTETFTPSWTQVWNIYGIDNTYHKNMVIAGRASDGMNMRSYVGNFTNGSGNTMIQRLSGASIVKAELYFVYRGIWNPNNVRIGLHNRHGATSVEPTVTDIGGVPVGAGQGKWLAIPSSRYAGLINGSFRGISFGRKSGAPVSEKWAEIYRHDSSNRPRIRITYIR